MESPEIYQLFVGERCEGCGGTKLHRKAFCRFCYQELPRALQSSLYKTFGSGFEEAYQACLSWFRTHPFQGSHRAKQKGLWEDAS